jgi:hypothetical protein
MTWQYVAKAIWSGLVTFGSSIGAALVATESNLGALNDGVWVVAIVLGLVSAGGILGWQAAPARISTGIKE